jgi:hypothetical protein
MSRRGQRRPPDLASALQLLGVEPPRYMLVDADTSMDIREAQTSEVEYVRRNANFSGVAMLKSCRVTLRKLTEVLRG